MPEEKAFLEGRQVVVEGKCLGRLEDTVKSTDDWERRLMVVCDRDSVPIGHFEVGLVPLKNVSTPSVFGKEDLRAKESNLEAGEQVSFAF
jgi:hypothetical protein